MNDLCQHHLNAIRTIICSIQDAGCHAFFMLKVPISNSLALKSADLDSLFPWGQHCFLGVAIDNHYSPSSTEERYLALNSHCKMLIVGKIALRLEN